MKAGERNPEIRQPERSMPLFEQSFTKFEQAHARATDPATSKQAAASVVNLGRTRDAIISILRYHGSLTDEQIWETYEARRTSSPMPLSRISPSGLRSRRAELVTLGFVEAAGGFNEDGTTWGITGKTAAKRNCIVWKLK